MKRVISVILISVMLLSFTVVTSASDAVTITVPKDFLSEVIRSYFGMIKDPLVTAFDYFISYMQYFAGWIASFF